MTVKIRMSRGGRKKQPFYSIVVADQRMPRDGRFIEKLGYYDPMNKDKETCMKWNTDRVNYWLETGAQPSGRIAKFIIEQKLGSDKVRAKLQGRITERVNAVQGRLAAEKAKIAAEEKAAADAAAAEAAAAEAPAETPAEA
ncbi:MAG: 30S ribosomal protein S16 [Alphaproteobacteria bacterium]|nr:30S ribosomal protein S16 [Alphaproteobacteria bacterium]